MKTLIYLFFATTILAASCAQNNNNTANNTDLTNNSISIKKEKIMKKFDAKLYENLPLDSTQQNTEKNRTYISGNKRIQVNYSNDTTVFISNTEINSPYSDWEKYSIATNKNQLRTERKHFHGMPIGIHKEYDEDGNVIKETDFDEHYTFTTDNLIKKMKKEYDIDIVDRKKVLDIERVKGKDKAENLRSLSGGSTEIEKKLINHRYIYVLSVHHRLPNQKKTQEEFLEQVDRDYPRVKQMLPTANEYADFLDKYYNMMSEYEPDLFDDPEHFNEKLYFSQIERVFPNLKEQSPSTQTNSEIESKREYFHVLVRLVSIYRTPFHAGWDYDYFYIDGKTGETIYIGKGDMICGTQ